MALGAAVVVVDLAVGPLFFPAAELVVHSVLEGVELVVFLGPLGDVAAEGAVVAEQQQRSAQPGEQGDAADDRDQEQHQRCHAQKLVQAVRAVAADHKAAKFLSHSLTVLCAQKSSQKRTAEAVLLVSYKDRISANHDKTLNGVQIYHERTKFNRVSGW